MADTPTGLFAESWARLFATTEAREQLLPILDAAIKAMPEDSGRPYRRALRALYMDLPRLLNLGCPVATGGTTQGGWDAQADPAAILGVRRG